MGEGTAGRARPWLRLAAGAVVFALSVAAAEGNAGLAPDGLPADAAWEEDVSPPKPPPPWDPNRPITLTPDEIHLLPPPDGAGEALSLRMRVEPPPGAVPNPRLALDTTRGEWRATVDGQPVPAPGRVVGRHGDDPDNPWQAELTMTLPDGGVRLDRAEGRLRFVRPARTERLTWTHPFREIGEMRHAGPLRVTLRECERYPARAGGTTMRVQVEVAGPERPDAGEPMALSLVRLALFPDHAPPLRQPDRWRNQPNILWLPREGEWAYLVVWDVPSPEGEFYLGADVVAEVEELELPFAFGPLDLPHDGRLPAALPVGARGAPNAEAEGFTLAIEGPAASVRRWTKEGGDETSLAWRLWLRRPDGLERAVVDVSSLLPEATTETGEAPARRRFPARERLRQPNRLPPSFVALDAERPALALDVITEHPRTPADRLERLQVRLTAFVPEAWETTAVDLPSWPPATGEALTVDGFRIRASPLANRKRFTLHPPRPERFNDEPAWLVAGNVRLLDALGDELPLRFQTPTPQKDGLLAEIAPLMQVAPTRLEWRAPAAGARRELVFTFADVPLPRRTQPPAPAMPAPEATPPAVDGEEYF